MSVLRRTRTEVAGAWRSLRYDMGRSPAEPPAGGPDVTSTGMGTFGINLPIDPTPAPAAGRPRRALAVTAFGTLTVIGAAGAYLAVVNGLGSMVSESTAAAGTTPPRAAATTSVGMGSSSSPVRVPAATRPVTAVVPPAPVPTDPAAPPTAAPAPPPPPSPVANTPIRSTKPTNPESHNKPPVPTPTAPRSSPSPTPSAAPSSSDSSGPGSPSPSPSDSAEPGESVSPSQSWHGRRHKRHH